MTSVFFYSCETAIRDCGVSAGGVFALRRFIAPPLVSKLPDGLRSNANPATASHGENPLSLSQKERFNPTRMGWIEPFGAEGGIFTEGEDTHTLRLTSELVDLRVEYANPRTLRCSVRDRPTVKINERSEKTDRSFIGAEGGIRTLVCFWHKLISSN